MVIVPGFADRRKSVMLRSSPSTETVDPDSLWTLEVVKETVQLLAGFRVNVEEAVPPAESCKTEGLNINVTHAGRPCGMDNVTVPLYPFKLCSVTTIEPVPPIGMLRE
jgi:hypothetical protein